MFKGFKLKALDFKTFTSSKENYEERKYTKTQIETLLREYVLDSDIINLTEVQKDWFPEINADIFISHSHADIKSATLLADYLKEKLGLTCFIDSYVWGYFNNLTNMLLKGEHLSLENVTYVSSNVHIMLSMALNNMIDKCECLIFYNTPNSLPIKDITNKTSSPWIYNELVISKIIRRRTKEEHRLLTENFGGGFNKKASAVQKKFYYDVDLSHLHHMDAKVLNEWVEKYNTNKGNNTYALDLLYDLYRI